MKRCGPCSFDEVTKDAARWCTKCEEGLCDDCEKAHKRSKSTRNHQVISIEDYRKIENISIFQICNQLGENLEWFCKSHDEVLCVVCVPSKHKACSDVIPITVSSVNSRQSAALSDLEETILGTLRNMKQCIKNRESTTKEMEKQELDVKTMVLETKTKLNNHLDKLQEKLLLELSSITHTFKSKYMKIIQQITNEVESIKNEIGAAKDYELKVSINSLIEKLSNDVEEFGKIMVSESATNLDYRDPKLDQAQLGINAQTPKNISDIKLKLITSFQIKTSYRLNVIGCVILTNDLFLMANDTNVNRIIEYSDTDRHIRGIPVWPYGIAVIDPDRIVVTYGSACRNNDYQFFQHRIKFTVVI
ncbi:Hypothetical predicted protein [Mytilus galloprovincialis]|uniref:B box-type domain-containing protein n=1 Tax=Mytilus galloprovincialis TaxID=29158 RepID=A0A8B6BYN1_MYTGA|nr:Hypothetical predicted protein [Mytilus galloprovincialis]